MVLTKIAREDKDTVVMILTPETVGDCKLRAVTELFEKIFLEKIIVTEKFDPKKVIIHSLDVLRVINILKERHVLIPKQVEKCAKLLLGHSVREQKQAA